jgi:hypothetical protein
LWWFIFWVAWFLPPYIKTPVVWLIVTATGREPLVHWYQLVPVRWGCSSLSTCCASCLELSEVAGFVYWLGSNSDNGLKILPVGWVNCWMFGLVCWPMCLVCWYALEYVYWIAMFMWVISGFWFLVPVPSPPDQLCCFGIMIKLPPLRSCLVFWDPLGWTDLGLVLYCYGYAGVVLCCFSFCLCYLLFDACVGCLVPGTTPITGTALCLHVPWMTWCVSCCCLLIPYYGRSWFPFLFLGRAGCGLRIW